jgi:mono/diheme cytochrome c family protein
MRTALTIVGCITLATAGGLVFTHSGVHDVSAMSPHNPAVSWAPHKTFAEAVAYRSQGLQPPPDLEKQENVRSGARLFRDNCVVCHGAPGMQPYKASRGLQPSPPNLLRAGRRNDPAEVFLTIKNGVKTTAMPAFVEILSDQQIWSIAAFLHKSRGIAASDFQQLNGIEPGTAGGG